MTNEQKAAVERAAGARTVREVVRISLIEGMQHVIENPSDFGLVEKRLVDAGIQLRIETVKTCEEIHLQKEKYREALECIIKETSSKGPWLGRVRQIAKEALKQQ